ncbi:hypothetical protein HDV02_002709 [Globomyces sp. JEL0801]|nr:hypothetical protein HDV02_002709 [Globomyces sp. JEL0801]
MDTSMDPIGNKKQLNQIDNDILLDSKNHPWENEEKNQSSMDSESKQNSNSKPDLDGKRRKRIKMNMVLPSYEEELLPDNSIERQSHARSYYQRFLHTIQSWYHFLGGTVEAKGISLEIDRLTKTPYDIEKVVIIGVHGWFPNKIFNPVIGEPVGTSAYFANKMEKALSGYFRDRHGIHLLPEDVEVIPLEGEGTIEERLHNLYNLLVDPSKDWKQKVIDADLVVLSAHSQGCPVSALLLSKLIQEQIVTPGRQRVGILAMAGISHGPYPHLKSSIIIKYVESDPAKQLFDFNNSQSTIARRYYEAMSHLLNSGCRYVAIGSWYDQVVPLYSATVQGLQHPNIYRALYIDAADYQPDFLSHLVVFALKLRNEGLTDHGILIHLSDALQGSIYGFGTQGHSAIYEEENTYTVAIAWIMGQNRGFKPNQANPPPLTSTPPLDAPTKINPHYLAWCMAKITSDYNIKQNESLRKDLEVVKELYKKWYPSASHLKDIKYRLEPLKAKL